MGGGIASRCLKKKVPSDQNNKFYFTMLLRRLEQLMFDIGISLTIYSGDTDPPKMTFLEEGKTIKLERLNYYFKKMYTLLLLLFYLLI